MPDARSMARIEAEVKRSTQKLAYDCKTKLGRPAKTSFRSYWRWDAQKKSYEPHTKELQQLDEWNQKRF